MPQYESNLLLTTPDCTSSHCEHTNRRIENAIRRMSSGRKDNHSSPNATVIPEPMTAAATTRAPKQRRRRSSDKQFPGKLHDMMAFVKLNELESIISWTGNGTAFVIHDPARLTGEILPLFFGQTKYRSFQRQLNMWHFQRIQTGPDQGAFIHPFFIEGQKPLCAYMSRHANPSEFLPDPLSAEVPRAETPLIDEYQALCVTQDVLERGSLEIDVNPVDVLPTGFDDNTVSAQLKKGALFGHDPFTDLMTDDIPTQLLNGPRAISAISDESQGEIKRVSESSPPMPFLGDKESTFSLDAIDCPPTTSTVSPIDFPSIPESLLEGMCPGLTTPASPETVESIFRELSDVQLFVGWASIS